MELSIQVLNQVFVIFILMITGAALYKMKIFTEAGVSETTNILVKLVMPCVIIDAYQTEFDSEILRNLLIALGVALIIHIVAILLATLIFRKKDARNDVNIFSTVYSNCGFMGIPLLTAVYGNEGVFYGSAYFVIFTILSWTHGIYIYAKGKNGFNIKKIVLNPGIIGTVIGISLFLLRITLPSVVARSVNYISLLNTPLAMLILGTYMAKIDYKNISGKMGIFIVTVLKLVIIPLAGVGIVYLMGIVNDVTGAVIISAACPVAATSALFASQYDSDAVYATSVVVVTTLLSVVTIPLIVFLL